jgi:hypothetical protein
VGPVFCISIAGRRPVARRPLWRALPGHSAVLGMLAAGLLLNPILSPAAAVVAELPAPAPMVLLAARPQVELEPFSLWWTLMGTPTVLFADPTLDAPADLALDETPAAKAAVPARGKLNVPFRTQLDGSLYAGSNCGPASLGMILEGFNVEKSTYDLRKLSHTYQGTWGSQTGTALEHLAHVAEDFGIGTRGLYDGWRFRQWSIADLREELRQGHPVMILVKYRLLPGHTGSRATDDHYIVLWDLDGDDFIYNDPAFTRGRDGYARTISASTLEQATRSAIIPRQAVAFLPPKS